MTSYVDKFYVAFDHLTSCKGSKSAMDPAEGTGYWKGVETPEFPPLYESVNGKETEDKSRLCPKIDRVLFPFKAFYFFFYGAIGSLFPFIALYFKHLWLSPAQAGLLVGLRPIVQSFSTPLWAMVADKCKVKKLVLFVGICGWLFTHTSILLVPAGEKPRSCEEKNASAPINEMKRRSDESFNVESIRGRSVSELERNMEDNEIAWRLDDSKFSQRSLVKGRGKPSNKPTKNSSPQFSTPVNGISPSNSHVRENTDMNTNEDDPKKSMWIFSNHRFPIQTWHTFAYVSVIIIIGNLFAAPAQTMANTATLQALAADTHRYGLQRCFGSIGWGFTAFVVGMLVSMNHDSALACKGLDDINYTPCFYAFGVLMLCALAVSSFFKFEREGKVAAAVQVGVCSNVRKELDPLTCFVLFNALFAGFNMGFIQTFLFWYLQTLGGTQKLFSLITGINAIGELIGFLLSVKLIDRFGHLKILSLGIAAYAVRLFVYGIVQDPWLVLPVEFLKFFTFSAVWASVLSFIGVSSGSEATLQSLVHMLFWGVGYGGGGILGGILTEYVGAKTVFLGLAFMSVLDVFAILLVMNLNCCPKRKQDIYLPVNSDEEEAEEEVDPEVEQ